MVQTMERIDPTYAYDAPTYSVAIVSISSLSSIFSEVGEPQPSTTTTIGSFTRDPIGYEGSPYDLYEFLSSRALIRTDPEGKNDADDPPVGNPNAGPILWPEPISAWPPPGEISDGKEGCVCHDRSGNRMRPTSPKTGKSPPVAGLPYAECDLGETVNVRYPGNCLPEADLPCKVPCKQSVCWVFKCFRCIAMTPSADKIREFPVLSTIRTGWGNCVPNPNANGKCQL